MVLIVITVLLGGCGAGGTLVRHTGKHADDLVRLSGESPLSDDAVRVIARDANVDSAVVTNVSGDLGSQAVWQKIGPQLEEFATSPIGKIATSAACKQAQGQASSTSEALDSAGIDLTKPEGKALAEATFALAETLTETLRTGNDADRAAVATFCYGVAVSSEIR